MVVGQPPLEHDTAVPLENRRDLAKKRDNWERITAVLALPLRHMLDIVALWDQNNIMKGIDTMPHEGFTVQDRALGRFAAWTAFIVNEAYAVVSGLGFLSLKSPSDPIGEPYLSIMALLIVLMAPFLIVTMVAVRAYAPPELKSLAYAALAFMILLAGITSSVNFALLIVSRQADTSATPWSLLFLPYRWPAVAYTLDIFAWDWFFALSMLFAAPLFRHGGLEKAARLLMIVSAVLCLLSLLWLLISPVQSIVIGILGWGVAGPVVFLLLAKIFGRAQPQGNRISAG